MKRRLLFLAVSVFLLFCCGVLGQGCRFSSTEKNFTSRGLEYTLNKDGKGYTVTGIGECLDKKIVIPSAHQKKPVVGIADYVFLDCYFIESIVVPSSVKTFGLQVFRGCKNLKELTVPFLGESASAAAANTGTLKSFFGYAPESVPESLEKVTVTSGTIVGASAFYGCKFINTVILPDEVTEIRSHAFAECENLFSFSFPEKLKKIESHAFWLSGLLEAELPDGLTEIEAAAFSHSLLSSVKLPKNLKVIQALVFSDCGIKKITIPYAVQRIERNAFWGCFNLTSVTILNPETVVEESAFEGCNQLDESDIVFGFPS